MKKYIFITGLLLFCLSVIEIYYLIHNRKNPPVTQDQTDNRMPIPAEEVQKNQKIRDLRFPDYQGNYIKIHMLDESGKYLNGRSMTFWEIVNGTKKSGPGNSFADETILIRPFVRESDSVSDPVKRRSITSSQRYIVSVSSDKLESGYSQDYEFFTPEIIEGKKEYEIFIKFKGVPDPYKP